MAFWSRFRQSKLKFHLLSNDFKRCHTLNYQPIVANQCVRSRIFLPGLNEPNCIVHSSLSEFYCNVRFYAAPVQANQKKEEKDMSGPRLNEEITAPGVRLVSDEGHFVISRYEALTRAKSLKMDLVEVDRHAKPPVCKIFDYHKEKYLQQTKEKERAKSKISLKKGGFKEVRFAAKIKEKDLQVKADMVKRLMESGHRVKCTAIEPKEDTDLATLLSRFSALIEDIAVEETTPQIEKKQAYIVVRHIKFGPPKKAGKKTSKSAVSSDTSNQSKKNQPFQENGGSETAKDSSDEVQATKSEWAGLDGGDDSHSVFDINDDESLLPKSSRMDKSAALSGPPPYAMDGNHPRHVVESTGVSTPSSPSNRYGRDPPSSGVPNQSVGNRYQRDPPLSGPNQSMGNRYARNLPPSGVPNQSMGNRYARDPPQFGASNQAKENTYARHPMSGRPSRVSTGTIENGTGNRFNGVSQFPNQGRQQQVTSPQSRPFQQDTSGSSSPKSYGAFSSHNANPTVHEKDVTPETNRYRKNDPSVRNQAHKEPQF